MEGTQKQAQSPECTKTTSTISINRENLRCCESIIFLWNDLPELFRIFPSEFEVRQFGQIRRDPLRLRYIRHFSVCKCLRFVTVRIKDIHFSVWRCYSSRKEYTWDRTEILCPGWDEWEWRLPSLRSHNSKRTMVGGIVASVNHSKPPMDWIDHPQI